MIATISLPAENQAYARRESRRNPKGTQQRHNLARIHLRPKDTMRNGGHDQCDTIVGITMLANFGPLCLCNQKRWVRLFSSSPV
jgi:hypothetical protein